MEGGGAEKVISMLANYYIEKGDDVDIALLLGPEVDYDLFNLSTRIRIVDLSKSQGGYLSNALYWMRSIRRYVKERKPDRIVSFIGRINALVLTATIGLRIPILVSERSNPKSDGRGFLMQKYCDFIYRRANAIVFQTNYAMSCFSSFHLSRSVVIPNPINFIDANESDINDSLVVAAGRLQPEKNHKMLISAIGLVHKSIPSIKCSIFGEGCLRDELQAQIDAEHLNGIVELPGVKKNILEYEAKAKVFVLTSNYEGLSNALMEAMMLGKICVSTDYDGVEDIIEDGINGIVIPRGDSCKLASVLVDVLLDEGGKYGKMGINAREKMKGYSMTPILEKWNSAIRNI